MPSEMTEAEVRLLNAIHDAIEANVNRYEATTLGNLGERWEDPNRVVVQVRRWRDLVKAIGEAAIREVVRDLEAWKEEGRS